MERREVAHLLACGKMDFSAAERILWKSVSYLRDVAACHTSWYHGLLLSGYEWRQLALRLPAA
jgi:hypothetical protein